VYEAERLAEVFDRSLSERPTDVERQQAASRLFAPNERAASFIGTAPASSRRPG
jgi:hypothetical protein